MARNWNWLWALNANLDIASQFESEFVHVKVNHFSLSAVQKCCATFVTNSDLVCQDCAMVVPGKGSASAASD
jgi:hypothetical protein